jgi:histidine triad (HIT) family protein
MSDCVFCRIADKTVEAVALLEDEDLLVFLDRCAIREAHCQIITKKHYATFETVPPDIAGRMVAVGQRLARRLKTIYGVERVAFLFTGGDVPHVHAHVVPMHEKTDITSARYILNAEEIKFSSDHLMQDRTALEAVRNKLQGF